METVHYRNKGIGRYERLRHYVPTNSGSGRRSSVRFTFPVVDRSTVLVNGPAAASMSPYANVIAPFRLVQAKLSIDTNQDVYYLCLSEELGNLGLTLNPALRLEQAVTSVLYKMWQQHSVSAKRSSGPLMVRWGSYEGPRCVYYPFDTLLAGDTSVYKTASFIVNDEKGLVSDGIDGDVLLPDDHDVEATQLVNNVDGKRIMILEEFSATLPVTAVFVTKRQEFCFGT